MRILGGLALIAVGLTIAWGAITGTLARVLAALVNPAWVGQAGAGGLSGGVGSGTILKAVP